MRVPQAMGKLTDGFHQDIFVLEPTLDGAVNHALGFLSASEKLEARSYLQNLLDGSNSASEIRSVWDKLPKDIRIDRDEEVVEFLRYILGVLSQST